MTQRNRSSTRAAPLALTHPNVRISGHPGHPFQSIPDSVSADGGHRFRLIPDRVFSVKADRWRACE